MCSRKRSFFPIESQITTGCFTIQFGDPEFNCVRFLITKTHRFTFFRVNCRIIWWEPIPYAIIFLAKERINSFSWFNQRRIVSKHSAFSHESGRSFMCTRNGNGSRTDSCGTPLWTDSLSVSISFNLTYCFRSFKQLPEISLIFTWKRNFALCAIK